MIIAQLELHKLIEYSRSLFNINAKSGFHLKKSKMQVKMTTGATIHTTEGLKMTVTQRIKPSVVPSLEMSTALKVDASLGDSKIDPLVCQKGASS